MQEARNALEIVILAAVWRAAPPHAYVPASL
jgi:hypothetical protein